MRTDISEASAPENLLMHTEGGRIYITNDVETVRKQLKKDSAAGEGDEARREPEDAQKPC
jgi:hypothetical protein